MCTTPRLFLQRQTCQYWIAACKRWACTACIHRVARRWMAILQWASQHGPVTLILREPLPLWRSAPAEQQADKRQQALAMAERLPRALSRLVEEVREQYGPMEYLTVVELTTGKRTPGHRPHLHLLVRGPHQPKGWLKERWRFHTRGSFMVDIQPLRSPEQAAAYFMGYTMLRRKQAQREHLGNWLGPRIRYSRRFFPRPVAEIRAILWPPVEPGMWEYVDVLPRHEQLTWAWPAPDLQAKTHVALT